MTRDLDRFEEQALCKLTSLMVTHGPVPVRALRRRQRVHLDIDTTVLPVLVIAVRTRQREHGKHRYLVEGLDWTVQTYRTNDMDSDPDDLAWDDDGRAGVPGTWATDAYGSARSDSNATTCGTAAAAARMTAAQGIGHRR